MNWNRSRQPSRREPHSKKGLGVSVRQLIEAEAFEDLAQRAAGSNVSEEQLNRMIELGTLRPELQDQMLAALVYGDWPDSLARLRSAFPVPSRGEIAEEGILLGNVVSGEVFGGPYRIPLAALSEHMLICGASGSGKSHLGKLIVRQLYEQGVHVLVLDPEMEYQVLWSQVPQGDMWVLGARELRINLLQPPPGVPVLEWVGRVCDLFREVAYLRDGSTNLQRKVMFDLLREQGTEADGFPCLTELETRVERLRHRCSSRELDYLHSLKNRYEMLRVVQEVFECRRGMDLSRLLDVPVVVLRFGRLEPDVEIMLTMLVVLWLTTYLERRESRGLRHVFVLEEVSRLLTGERYDLGEPLLLRTMRRVRKRGAGVLLMDQAPDRLPSVIRANTSAKVSFRLGDGDGVWAMGNSMRLDERQRDELGSLSGRVAIVKCGGQGPFQIVVPEMNFDPGPSEEELHRQMEASLDSLKWEPVRDLSQDTLRGQRVAGAKARGGGDREFPLSMEAWDVLRHVAEQPLLSTSERTEACRLSGWKTNSIQRELKEGGFIQVVRVSPGGRGKAFNLWEISPQGVALLLRHGVRVRQERGRGGIVHKWWCVKIASWIKDALGWEVEIEKESAGKSVDVGMRMNGVSIAVEVALSTAKGEQELRNAALDLEAGYDRVLVLCEEEGRAEKLSVAMGTALGGEERARVRVGYLKDFEGNIERAKEEIEGGGGGGGI